MCGIAGGWTRGDCQYDDLILRASLDAIRHRGPDDTGTFQWRDERSGSRLDLGLVRLAILDLSKAGHQPMTLPGNRYTISFNGEITNYVELREELISRGETFTSGTDTEVLLKAWATWGVDALDRLEGMFAFAVLDAQQGTLTLARDPFGVKPLFYFATPERLWFNSELQGLLATGIVPRRLDWQTALDYLQWSAYDHTDRTFIEDVKQLRPGHYVVLDTESGRLGEPVRYWFPPVATEFTGTYDDAVERVRDLFLDSVRRNLRSDVSLGVALSGGIDSTAIVGATRHLEPEAPIHTFSFVAPEYSRSEHEWVDLAVKATGATAHTVTPNKTDLSRDLDELICAQAEPFGSTSIYAQFRVFKLAREFGVTVTLDGQGGDEIFAGYSGYPAQRMHTLLETGAAIEATRFLQGWGSWPDRSRAAMLLETGAQFAPLRVRHRLRRPLMSPLLDVRALHERGIETHFPNVGAQRVRGERLKTHLRGALSVYGLPALLRHGDRNSMFHSIESRVPFLDRALTEFTLSLPEPWLISRDGTSKKILRDAVAPWVPSAITNRRDKVGFETPEDDWLQQLGASPADPDHRIGFLKSGPSDTLTSGLTEKQIRWGPRSHWRLINLRRWVTLFDIDAST